MATTTSPRDGRRAALRRSPVLALALLGGACSSAGVGGAFVPFSSPTNVVAADSLTVQRIRGGNPEVAPLTPEDGNVWPQAEAPRPTLLSGPEEAMRNIPQYSPSLIQGAPPASSPVPTPGSNVGPRAPRGATSTPSQPIPLTEAPRSPPPPPAPAVTSREQRLEGRPMIDPSGRPAIGTGGTPRVQGFTQPGVGGGAVIRDGNVETWIGPDGQARTRVAPN
jgi:hypothetical protein